MDNFRFDISSIGDAALKAAISVAMTEEYGRQNLAVGYSEDPEKGLILYRYPSPAMTRFLYGFDIDETTNAVSRWLSSADYGKEPSHDGSNSKGFRVYNESWGRIGEDYSAFVAIKPLWAWHGK